MEEKRSLWRRDQPSRSPLMTLSKRSAQQSVSGLITRIFPRLSLQESDSSLMMVSSLSSARRLLRTTSLELWRMMETLDQERVVTCPALTLTSQLCLRRTSLIFCSEWSKEWTWSLLLSSGTRTESNRSEIFSETRERISGSYPRLRISRESRI